MSAKAPVNGRVSPDTSQGKFASATAHETLSAGRVVHLLPGAAGWVTADAAATVVPGAIVAVALETAATSAIVRVQTEGFCEATMGATTASGGYIMVADTGTTFVTCSSGVSASCCGAAVDTATASANSTVFLTGRPVLT